MKMWICLPVLLIAAGTAWPAAKTTQVSIGQFEQLLSDNQGKPDKKVAEQLAGLELNQRASRERLARWNLDFRGSHARRALLEIADASAFLDLPPADISAAPAPDPDAQRQILSRMMDYLGKTLPKLPDFSATRETTRFEDTPAQAAVEQFAPMHIYARHEASPEITTQAISYRPMHFVGTSSERVTYRDGAEVDEKHGSGHDLPATGLTTLGEFGPILGVVIGDIIHGHIGWGYWQKSESGAEAVFRYQVPQNHSRYRVDLSDGLQTAELLPAYHGEITLDPASGAILRISVVAELPPPYQMAHAAMAVEYAPVAIGQQTYICPVRGVAISTRPLDLASPQPSDPVQTWLNNVDFSQYHLFRAETRILP